MIVTLRLEPMVLSGLLRASKLVEGLPVSDMVDLMSDWLKYDIESFGTINVDGEISIGNTIPITPIFPDVDLDELASYISCATNASTHEVIHETIVGALNVFLTTVTLLLYKTLVEADNYVLVGMELIGPGILRCHVELSPLEI